ncbi:hypothetical protein DL96DRAFT_1704826 [Flagelloscypha sp. PMI_526]|nr:hypothetical protein DL96DRAFT_1704826 [Flagelloscypha sp. PMI_526]
MKLALFNALAAAVRATAALTLDIPLANQLPTIARVDVPYTWTFSPFSFGPPSTSIRYSVKGLPDWLHFDSDSRTFSGQATIDHVGHPEMVLVAQDKDDIAYSRFSISVSSNASPQVHKPILEQFHEGNPSLSSLFPIFPNSALHSSNPALRVPPNWSFSAGFDWNTFISDTSLQYAVLLQDGSPLPPWIHFNPRSVTLNGYTPKEYCNISLALHATDEQGYSAISLPFNLFVSQHDLSLASSLPTINITSGASFNFSLNSPSDLVGLLLDGKSISSSQVESIFLDTSVVDWLRYDKDNVVLGGEVPADLNNELSLPITIITSNQTIHTNVSLKVVPSFFTTNTLPSMSVSSFSKPITFSLPPYFSNATHDDLRGDVNLTASFEPPSAQDSLKFDASQGVLSGTVPKNLDASHVSVTFTAYSRITHSTSHASLAIASPHGTASEADNIMQIRSKRSKLILALEIVFGIVGGLCTIGAFLAWSRHCLRVEDTALTGEESHQAWSEKDRKWYGLSTSPAVISGRNFTPNHIPPRTAMEMERDETSQSQASRVGLGFGSLKRSISSGLKSVSSPGFMSKRDFMARVKEKVRQVSGSYRARRSPPTRPIIGKPILKNSDLETMHRTFHASTIMSGSPSSSTGQQSVPRQRPEFAPPGTPPQVHFSRASLSRQSSAASSTSLASIRTHAEEAVVQIATRAPSIRSAKTASFASQASELIRPRLVPFTSVRVPVPLSPSSATSGEFSQKRVRSLHAELHKSATSRPDDLKMGLHYVQTLGADGSVTPSGTSFTTTARRSSFSSLESSHQGHSRSRLSVGRPPELALLARVEERFSSRVPVHVDATTKNRELEVRQMNGASIPAFLKVNLNNVSGRYGAVLFSGVPKSQDKGKMEIGVFLREEGMCVARVVLEVVGRS